MAAKWISVKCPECGATLKIEEGRDAYFCTHCGSKVVKTYENEKVIRTIDEARLAETDNAMKLKLMELERQERLEQEAKKEWDGKRPIYTRVFFISTGMTLLCFLLFDILPKGFFANSGLLVSLIPWISAMTMLVSGLLWMEGSQKHSAEYRKEKAEQERMNKEKTQNKNVNVVIGKQTNIEKEKK